MEVEGDRRSNILEVGGTVGGIYWRYRGNRSGEYNGGTETIGGMY